MSETLALVGLPEAGPKTHVLKCWPRFFRRVWDGSKRAELRRNDRNFEVGDVLELREWNPETGEYTGAWTRHLVTHIVADPEFGLKDGHVMLSLGDSLVAYDPLTGVWLK